MARLREPDTHAALGRALGEDIDVAIADRTAAAPTPDQPPPAAPLVPPEAFQGVRDNAPFRRDEQPAWFAALAAVRQREAAELAQDSIGVVGYTALNSQPDVYRGRVVTVTGRVLRVEPTVPAANDLGIERLWRVTMQPAGGEVWPITIYTIEQPAPVGGSPDGAYDASAVGLFFKKLSYRWEQGVGSTPVLIAKRLETTLTPPPAANAATDVAVAPTDTQPDINLEIDFTTTPRGSLGRALLADLGVDLELFAEVTDKQRLLGAENKAFYALLGAVGQTPAAQLVRLARAGLDDYSARRIATGGQTPRDRQVVRAIEAKRDQQAYSVVPLYGDGAAERGELVVFDAVVRRAVRVDASDSDAAAENGLDHYYELEAFTDDSQNLPLVFVVRDLPKGFPVGDAIRQPARLAGFFFKQWAYRSRYVTEEGDDRRQFAPLLVGRAPIPLATPDAASMRPGAAIGVVAAGALAITALVLWRVARRDRQYESNTLSRFRNAADGASRDFDRLSDLVDPSGR